MIEVVGIPRLSPTENVYINVTERNGEKRIRMARPEHNCVDWMENFANKFSKHGEIVFDLFPGSFATVKVCLELPRHLQVVVCEVDANCYAE